MISVLYQNASTSQILEPSPQGLISSVSLKEAYIERTKGLASCFIVRFFLSSHKSWITIQFWVYDGQDWVMTSDQFFTPFYDE